MWVIFHAPEREYEAGGGALCTARVEAIAAAIGASSEAQRRGRAGLEEESAARERARKHQHHGTGPARLARVVAARWAGVGRQAGEGAKRHGTRVGRPGAS
jgi:hypothetical protein